jgi:hypothetical protein
MAALLGMLTGIGGGLTRDVLLAEIPTVLRADLYAVAALTGEAVVVIGAGQPRARVGRGLGTRVDPGVLARRIHGFGHGLGHGFAGMRGGGMGGGGHR